MYFLDADSVSLFSKEDVQLIDAPTLATDGTLASAGTSLVPPITLDAAGMEALKTTETIQLAITLNTPDDSFAALLNSYKLKITLSIKVTN